MALQILTEISYVICFACDSQDFVSLDVWNANVISWN